MKKISKDLQVSDYTPDASGTCLQGHIETTYKKLKSIFGTPFKGDGYKIQAEWFISTPDGIATIYDYKEGKNYCGKDGISKTEVTNWHIGGHKPEVAEWIKKIINQ